MTATLESVSDIQKFIHGGKAIFTLRSRRTDKHYTFKVKKKKDGLFYVSLLSDGYKYIGSIVGRRGSRNFVTTRASKLDLSSEAVRAFKWSFDWLQSGQVPVDLEFSHVGRCARCSRPLTQPDSIKSGFGPECSSRSYSCV